MPVLFIYGVPDEMGEKLEEFRDALDTSVANSLGIRPFDVSCFFPTDLLKKGLGKEIIIFVEGLYARRERTKEVRSKLAENIAVTTRLYFPHTYRIECFIHPFNPTQGFCVSTNEKLNK